MSTIKHLKKCVEILRKHYEDEIQEEKDWFWALSKWEINISIEDDCESIVAYRRYNTTTDWSDYVILSQKVREWKTIV